MGLEPTIPASERAETDGAAAVTGGELSMGSVYVGLTKITKKSTFKLLPPPQKTLLKKAHADLPSSVWSWLTLK
jgi:hypothetical protein